MATRKPPRNHLADDLPDLEDLWPAKSTPDKIFESLARNAFDFLERGIQEFDKSPKYSVIHFCAAVEMLLKARLMKEHWSLIVSKPEQAVLAKFMAGDFISVTLDEARVRLRDIADVDIPAEAFESFRRLATHRNKMIHFFHADIEDDNDARAKIVAEHCRSWLHLHQLLNHWEDYFEDFSSEIARAERSMKSHRKFLRVKFDALKATLAELRKTGQKLQKCSACEFKAALVGGPHEKLPVVKCLVCDHKETRVELDCPHCGRGVVLTTEGYATCPHCGGAIEPDNVADHLVDSDVANAAAMAGDHSYSKAHCSDCDGYETIVRVGDKYFCTNSFQIFDSHELQHCAWCGAANVGDMTESHWRGCVACDGCFPNLGEI